MGWGVIFGLQKDVHRSECEKIDSFFSYSEYRVGDVALLVAPRCTEEKGIKKGGGREVYNFAYLRVGVVVFLVRQQNACSAGQ